MTVGVAANANRLAKHSATVAIRNAALEFKKRAARKAAAQLQRYHYCLIYHSLLSLFIVCWLSATVSNG